MSLATGLPRLDELRRMLEQRDLAAAVICSYESLRYLTGADIITQLHLREPLELFVAVRGEEPSLLVA